MEFLYEYGLFLAKAVTIVIAIAVVIGLAAGAAMKPKAKKGELELTNLSDEMRDTAQSLTLELAPKSQQKQIKKEQKKQEKEREESEKHRLFVLDFKAGIQASEVDNLREEVTALLSVATENDQVLVRLESGGGVVHGYGLAASQLQRIRDKKIPLTVAVDKVAASGGYMMACVADKIIAAPFAIIGSIGVLAQIPNFHKLLKKHDIDFEQVTAGEFKRTLTMFGKNTEKGREKFQEELEEVHTLFKQHIIENRELDIDDVATGEHWMATQAYQKGLVDELMTSDEWLLSQIEEREIFSLHYTKKKGVAEKVGLAASVMVESSMDHLSKIYSRYSSR